MSKISRRLAQRLRQSAIVSDMTITHFDAMRRAWDDKKNFTSAFEKVLIAMLISRNDDAGGAPLTVSEMAKMLNIPRTNIKRATDALIGEGAVLRKGNGYALNLRYMQRRIDADYFKVMIAAIIKAADQLRK